MLAGSALRGRLFRLLPCTLCLSYVMMQSCIQVPGSYSAPAATHSWAPSFPAPAATRAPHSPHRAQACDQPRPDLVPRSASTAARPAPRSPHPCPSQPTPLPSFLRIPPIEKKPLTIELEDADTAQPASGATRKLPRHRAPATATAAAAAQPKAARSVLSRYKSLLEDRRAPGGRSRRQAPRRCCAVRGAGRLQPAPTHPGAPRRTTTRCT